MTIINTFVAIADDCPNSVGIIPPLRSGALSLARLQYELLNEHPYEYDLDALNFTIHCLKGNISGTDVDKAREAFFARSHPCMRASPLTKQYGFGAHYDWAGRIAIYPADAIAYQKFLRDPALKIEKALRNKRLSSESAGLSPSVGPEQFQPAA